MSFKFPFKLYYYVGRDSSVGIATLYGLDGPGIPVGARFSAPVQTGPGAHQASYSVAKRPGSGVDHHPHLAPR